MKPAPTIQQYGGLQDAYDYFNAKLFGGELSRCMIEFGRNEERTLGYFHAEQWEGKAGKCHTIALTPMWLRRPIRDVFSTLVHEMCHLWQQDCGKPSRNGYHNKEWGDKMKAVGLHPSNTGKPGGRETGQQMTHYIVEGGPFDRAFARMPKGIMLPWVGIVPGKREKKPRTPSKVKYSVPSAG
jgi:hypothetical protein